MLQEHHDEDETAKIPIIDDNDDDETLLGQIRHIATYYHTACILLDFFNAVYCAVTILRRRWFVSTRKSASKLFTSGLSLVSSSLLLRRGHRSHRTYAQVNSTIHFTNRAIFFRPLTITFCLSVPPI